SERFLEDLIRRNSNGEGLFAFYAGQELPVSSISIGRGDQATATAFYLSTADVEETAKVPAIGAAVPVELTVDADETMLMNFADAWSGGRHQEEEHVRSPLDRRRGSRPGRGVLRRGVDVARLRAALARAACGGLRPGWILGRGAVRDRPRRQG